MKLAEALEVFGTKAAIADLLSIRPQNVAKWGGVVPEAHRVHLVICAKGKLKVRPAQIDEWERKRAELGVALKWGRPAA